MEDPKHQPSAKTAVFRVKPIYCGGDVLCENTSQWKIQNDLGKATVRTVDNVAPVALWKYRASQTRLLAKSAKLSFRFNAGSIENNSREWQVFFIVRCNQWPSGLWIQIHRYSSCSVIIETRPTNGNALQHCSQFANTVSFSHLNSRRTGCWWHSEFSSLASILCIPPEGHSVLGPIKIVLLWGTETRNLLPIARFTAIGKLLNFRPNWKYLYKQKPNGNIVVF